MKLLKVIQYFVQQESPNGDLVKGSMLKEDKYITSETLITHKSTGLKTIIRNTKDLMKLKLDKNAFYNKKTNLVPSSIG